MNTLQGELTMFENKELAEQTLKNQTKVTEIREEREVLHNENQAERYRIMYDVFQPQIRELEHRRDEAIETAHADITGKIAAKDEEIKSLMVVVHQAQLIIDYLRLDASQDLELKNARVYNGRHFEDLGYFFNDKYLKAKLFIFENRKPVNKYTLAVIGRCLFYEELLRLPRNYGIDINFDGRVQLEVVLKEGPRIDALKDWLDKNRESLLREELAKYQAVKTEYEEALRHYSPEDFRSLYKFVCPECGYFYHILENYSWREPMECPHDRTVMVAPDLTR